MPLNVGFQQSVDNGTSVMAKFVDTVLTSGVKMEIKTVEQRSDYEMTRDKTTVKQKPQPKFR